MGIWESGRAGPRLMGVQELRSPKRILEAATTWRLWRASSVCGPARERGRARPLKGACRVAVSADRLRQIATLEPYGSHPLSAGPNACTDIVRSRA